MFSSVPVSSAVNQNNNFVPYMEVVKTTFSTDGTFDDINDLFEKLSLRFKCLTDKERIFNIYSDCIPFGKEESKKLNDYIKTIQVKERDCIFDYYD